jgi:hypothetical protein
MASDFDLLRRKLAQAIHTGDCKSARVLGAKLQFAARTPSERGAVHRAQSRLRSCVSGLSGARGHHKKLAARKRLKRANKLKRHPKPLIMKWGKAIDYDTKMALSGARGNKPASDRLFIGVFPGGISFADKSREKNGDYMQVAFLPYDTLELEWRAGKHPADMRKAIERHARSMAKRRGEEFAIDSSGHKITLGRRRSGLSGPGVVRFLSSKSTRAAMNREGLTLREWVNAARFGTNIHGDANRNERAAWRASEDPTDFYRR